MYYCPECHKPFTTEKAVTKHYLACFKENHPYIPPKPVAYTSTTTRKVDSEVANFFSSLKEK